MSEEKALAIKPDAPIEWGSREEVTALADRLKTMLPGKLTTEEALLLAQYSAAMDANPFREEIYAYQSRGKVVLVEGYKLLVRWARRQCNFYERYERVTNGDDTVADDDIAFRCRLLRDDALPALADLTQAGVPNAYEITSTEAIGVVRKADRTTREGKPQSPPIGWTWEEVARKRALKNAINRAYGTPSPREIAEESWTVEDTLTIPSDWETITPEMVPTEREILALANARQRTREPLQETAAESMAALGFGPEPEVAEPEPAQEAPGNGNGKPTPWHNRTDLVNRARAEIGYYGDNSFHIIGALKKLEAQGHVEASMDDDTLFKKLNAYAKMRADEKAAEEEA